MEPRPGDTIAVWFSCGAASAVAAKRTIEKYGDICHILIVNNPVIEEHKDNRRFLADCEEWLGQPIEFAINPKYPSCSAVDVWTKRAYMAGPNGAPCTINLKKKAREHWEKSNPHDWMVLGFCLEEKNRYDRFVLGERDNVLPILIEDRITKEMCYRIVSEAGLRLPEIYHRGFPNANCIGCVKASSATYWNLVRKEFPEIFEERAKQSRELGCKLVRSRMGAKKGYGKRVFLDELPADETGHPLKNMQVECGIFCGLEERSTEDDET